MPLSRDEILTFCRSAAKAQPFAAHEGSLYDHVISEIRGSGYRITKLVRDRVDCYLTNLQTKARQGIHPDCW